MSAADSKAPAAAAAAAGAGAGAAATAAAEAEQQTVLFLSHGAGPCFFMDDDDGFFAAMNSKSDVRKWFDGAAKYVRSKPTAILVISAHWETSGKLAVYSQQKTAPLYDYYGFPQSTYDIKYSPPGSPAVAKQVAALLNAANLPCVEETSSRGLDHGAFIPLKMLYPAADIPVLQLSLLSTLDPAQHYAIGRALAPLRKQGVLIIGSGQATHGKPRPDKPTYAREFDAWLTGVVTGATGAKRADALRDYLQLAPNARLAHPRAEHYVPLLVAAGAAADDTATKILDAFPIDFFSLACYSFDTAKPKAAAAAAPAAK